MIEKLQMAYPQEQITTLFAVIEKVLSKTKQHCESLADQFFGSINPQAFKDSIIIFQDALTTLTCISKESFNSTLQKLKSLNGIITQDQPQITDIYADLPSQLEFPQLITEMVVKKERQKEYDYGIDSQLKKAKRKFFTQTIRQKLNEYQIREQNQIKIVELFMQAKQDYGFEMDKKKLEKLSEYRKQIDELNQEFQQMKYQLLIKGRVCPAIAKITRLKLTSLRVIHFQYSQLHYQISALELFKIVHNNKELNQVTIKRVYVKQFQQFIAAMRSSNNSGYQNLEQYAWIKDFKPLKSLKLAVNAFLQFKLQQKDSVQSTINDLTEFVKLFDSVSDITSNIKFIQQGQLALEQRNTLQHLIQSLKMLTGIKIKIYSEDAEVNQSFALVFSALASLTQITQIQFQGFRFSSSVDVNQFLAMEQALSTIFDNNQIACLILNGCLNFPVFPANPNLRAINLLDTSFRRQGSVNMLGNTSLRLIVCQKMQGLSNLVRMEQQLFNQLETLYFKNCCNGMIVDISTHTPSNIKHLQLSQWNYRSNDCLSMLFSKLAHLVSFITHSVHFGNQICSIPSPDLEQLHIYFNHTITNADLQAIDKKWPCLRYITLRDCYRLDEKVWSACEFKRLISLKVDTQILDSGHHIRQLLKTKGVKVQQ